MLILTFYIISIACIFISIGGFSTFPNRQKRVLLVLMFAVMLATQIWRASAIVGMIGEPSALSTSQRYQVASVTELTSSSIVLLIHKDGQISSCGFQNPVTVPIGAFCKIDQRSDGSYVLIPY
jgi:hypothetical protein